jgi:hypothetical protein
MLGTGAEFIVQGAAGFALRALAQAGHTVAIVAAGAIPPLVQLLGRDVVLYCRRSQQEL